MNDLNSNENNVLIGWLWLTAGVTIGAAAGPMLKWSRGFTHWKMGLAGTVLSLLALVCWTMTLRHLPLGLSCIIWEGLGGLTAVLIGIAFFQEKFTLPMIGFSLLVLLGCAGLFITTKQT